MAGRWLRGAGAGAAVLAAIGFTPAAIPEASIEVTIHEGTNMAAALSPDGSTLAIDLLGRIWTLPAAGGEARALTRADGDARQPSWSPDGRRIAFQAYWAGDYDIWVVGTDGGALRQLTHGPFDDREPHWSPDGDRVAFSSDRGGTYDIWEVDLATGTPRRLTQAPENEYGPAYAPDGRRLAWVADGDASGVWVRDGGGRPERVVELAGQTGYAPSWSPDGTRIAYGQHVYGASRLRIVPAAGGAGHGQAVSADDEDVFPFRASWTGDGRLLYTADGRVRSRPVDGGGVRDVPLSARVTLDRPAYRKALRSFDDSRARPVRGIVSPAVSPDGSRVAFSALGDLWVMPIGGEPERLTDDVYTETDPMWSPDGTRLAFGTDRSGSGEIWVHELATGTARRLTQGGGSMAVWSPDGDEIAFLGGNQGTGVALQVVDVATGTTTVVRAGLNNPGRPTWAPGGDHLAVSAHWTYSSRFREGVNKALLIARGRAAAAEDSDEPAAPRRQNAERWLDFVAHASVGTRTTDGPVWSPDGRSMAFVSAGVLWTVPVTPQGDALGPPRRLTNELADDPTWTADSRSIVYLTDDRLRRVHVDDGRIEDVPVPLTWRPTLPEGRVVVHAGGLFDGISETLRRDVDVVVQGHRIVRVEPHDEMHHTGQVVDAADGVVAPGLIEMHTHGGLGMGESNGRLWLSYGVTSIRSPAADAYETVEAREAVESGRRIGPRMFGTGGTVDGSRIYYSGAPSLSSSAQVDLELERARTLGYDLVKTYVRLSDPVQRRVVAEAHAAGIPVTSHELYPAVAYGVDGVEHVKGTSRRGYSTKVSELNRSYQDVVALLSSSGMTITPTVGIYGAYALLVGDDPSLFDDARVRAFFPWAPMAVRPRGDPESARRMVEDMAALARRVVEAGGVVVVGTDSPIIPQGLSLHAEMEALVRYGGMRPVDVLRATTSASAAALGYGQDLGSVRPGMLADLVVFGGDPLTDIRNTRRVRTVVKDGRVYHVDRLLEAPQG